MVDRATLNRRVTEYAGQVADEARRRTYNPDDCLELCKDWKFAVCVI